MTTYHQIVVLVLVFMGVFALVASFLFKIPPHWPAALVTAVIWIGAVIGVLVMEPSSGAGTLILAERGCHALRAAGIAVPEIRDGVCAIDGNVRLRNGLAEIDGVVLAQDLVLAARKASR